MEPTTDWSGEDYADISALQRTMAEEAVASLRFAGNERVLDVGCGDGYVTRLVAAMVPDGYVVGIDPARGMLADAARRGRPAACGPSFVRADIRHLPFGECFDAAVSFNALHWVPQQQQALEQIASVVHGGAGVLIQVVCAGERPSVEEVAMTLCHRPRWAPHFVGFSAPFVHVDPARYRELAAAAGLTVNRITVADREWDFGTRERFARWLAVGSGAWTDRLDRPRSIGDLVDAYESVSERPGLFGFAQMRAELIRR